MAILGLKGIGWIYSIIDSYETIRFALTFFNWEINYFQSYFLHHVMTEEKLSVTLIKFQCFYN